ncbi:MAG: hypothetical protein AAF741_13610 [Bacteroidota bacterium]
MGLFSRRTPKHQVFNYKPRYWDPDKEEREERRRRRERLRDQGVEGQKERIRSGFVTSRGGAQAERYRTQQLRKSSMTLVIVIGVLIVLTLYALNYWMPQIEGWLE